MLPRDRRRQPLTLAHRREKSSGAPIEGRHWISIPQTLQPVAGEASPEPSRPVFVVATQTIEVGANLDFDALVTEAAPLAALRQRFGRLDRLGRRGHSPAAIMYRKPEKRGPDPVYGDDLEQTWKWLVACRRSVAPGRKVTTRP